MVKWWKWESIGATLDQDVEHIAAGIANTVEKKMTLAEERGMELVRNGLTYVTGDHHSPDPHWHANYPWTEDPASLPNNKRAVEATFLSLEKQLAKEPSSSP